MRYVYLGDAMTAPALVNQPCDPVRREDGKCIVSTRMASALVVFADGSRRVVKRRRLRVVKGVSGVPASVVLAVDPSWSTPTPAVEVPHG